MAHEVFISHSSKDKQLADAVVATLEKNGIKCFVAPRDILPGASWAKSILDGIESSRLMLLVFSEHTNTSEHCRREVERAVKFQIPVVPLRVRDVLPADEMEYFLSASHWLDAITPPFEQHLAKLSEKFRVLLDLKPDPITPEAASAAPAAAAPLNIPPTPQPLMQQADASTASNLMNARLPAWLAVAAIAAVIVLAVAAVAAIFIFTRNGNDKLASSPPANLANVPPKPTPDPSPAPSKPVDSSPVKPIPEPSKPAPEPAKPANEPRPEKPVEPPKPVEPSQSDTSKALTQEELKRGAEVVGVGKTSISSSPQPKPDVPTPAPKPVMPTPAPKPTPSSPLPPSPVKPVTPAPQPKPVTPAPAPPRPADTKVRLKTFTPAGSAWTFSNRQELVGTSTSSSMMGVQTFPVKSIESITGSAEVLESNAAGRPTALRLTFDAGCSGTTEVNGMRNSVPSPLAGHTITVRKDADGDVENDFNGELDTSTENYLDHILDPDFGMPPNAVGIGESWSVSPKSIAERMDFEPDQSRLSITGKLKEFRDVGGRRAGLVELAFNLRGVNAEGVSSETQTSGTTLIDLQTGECLQGNMKGTVHVITSQQRQAPNGMQMLTTVDTRGTLTVVSEQKLKKVGSADANAPALSGTFENENLTIVFTPGDGGTSMQISFGETKYNGSIASMDAGGFTGKFKTADNEEYDFSGSYDGTELTFKSAGNEYKLKKKNPFEVRHIKG